MSGLLDSIRQHYEKNEADASLVSKVTRILDSLPEGSVDSSQLSGLDQFHVMGLEATKQLAQMAGIESGAAVLDAGSGLGGPSRYLASSYGCRVIGVDLSPSFVAVAQLIAQRTGLHALVSYQTGDLLALPFTDNFFDVVWTQHVVMNIRDRERVYREFKRVLRPGGKLAFYDALATHGKPELHFPVPWAESSGTSFLLTQDETSSVLATAGFNVTISNDVTVEALTWMGQQRPAAQGLNLGVVMGPRFAEMGANLARNVREGRVRFVMAVCTADRARN